MKTYENTPSEKHLLQEAAAAYESASLQQRMSDHLYLAHIRDGMTSIHFFKMLEDSGLSLEEMANILHVTSRTLRRIEHGQKLSLDISEKILQLRRLYNAGTLVFGDREKFVQWLRKPLMALDGSTPLSYLDTSFGIDIILSMLGRIEHGVYS